MAVLPLRYLLLLGTFLDFTFGGNKYCPEVQVIQSLELPKLAGDWWVWDFFGMNSYTEPHKCHVSHFYPMPDGKTIKVINDYVYMSGDKESHVRYPWLIQDEDPAPNGNLQATLTITRRGELKVKFEVIDTDYTSYLVIRMCKGGFFKVRSSLTLLRNITMKPEELEDISKKVEAALAKSNLKREDLGLFHGEFSTKNCKPVTFPKGVTDGKTAVLDAEEFKAEVNAVAAHVYHADEDASQLLALSADPSTNKAKFAKQLRAHSDDIKSIAKDVKELSSF